MLSFFSDIFVYYWVEKVFMEFQYVAFPPSRVSFSTTFLKNSDEDGNLGTISCLKTVFGVGGGMLPLRYFSSYKALFCQ